MPREHRCGLCLTGHAFVDHGMGWQPALVDRLAHPLSRDFER